LGIPFDPNFLFCTHFQHYLIVGLVITAIALMPEQARILHMQG